MASVKDDSKEKPALIDLADGQPPDNHLPVKLLSTAIQDLFSPPAAGTPSKWESDPQAWTWLQYGDNAGHNDFRKTLSTFLTKQYGCDVKADNLFIAGGVSHGVEVICNTLMKPGDTVFVENPTYFLALLIFKDYHLNVVGVPVDEQGMDMDVFEALLTKHHPRLVYTIPIHHNPTGATLSAERRTRLIQLSMKHNFYVLCDEVYQLLSLPDVTPPRPMRHHLPSSSSSSSSEKKQGEADALSFDNIISVGSFSKTLCPGIRVGWLECSTSIIDRLVKNGAVWSGGCICQFNSLIVQNVLNKGLLEPFITNMRALNQRQYSSLSNALREFLPSATFIQARGGYFVWIKLNAKPSVSDGADARSPKRSKLHPSSVVDSAKFLAFAREKYHVVFKAGGAFFTGHDLSSPPPVKCDDYIRICFARESAEAIREGVKRIGAAWSHYEREFLSS